MSLIYMKSRMRGLARDVGQHLLSLAVAVHFIDYLSYRMLHCYASFHQEDVSRVRMKRFDTLLMVYLAPHGM